MKILKFALAAALATMLLMNFAACEKADNISNVCDFANLIAENEVQKIETAAKRAGKSVFLIATHDSTDSFDSLSGDELLAKLGYSDKDNIVALIITLDNGAYHYDFYAYGTAARRISDSEKSALFDDSDVKSSIRNGALAKGVELFIEKAEICMAIPWLGIVAVALFVGIAAGAFCCAVVLVRYKIKNTLKIQEMSGSANLELTASEDVFLTSRVKVREGNKK